MGDLGDGWIEEDGEVVLIVGGGWAVVDTVDYGLVGESCLLYLVYS